MTGDNAALYRLMTWLSPAYPLGAFSYSHGLEAAVEEGAVRDRASLCGYVGAVIEHGAGAVDAALFAAAWHAAHADEDQVLDEIADLAEAWRGTSETRLESAAQGAAFLRITQTAWPHPALTRFATRRNSEAALSVAIGAAAAWHGIALAPALLAFLQALAANLISAGVRLVPLGQTDGQLAVAALEQIIAAAAAAAEHADLAELGSAAPLIDCFSINHESQYTRLFRS